MLTDIFKYSTTQDMQTPYLNNLSWNNQVSWFMTNLCRTLFNSSE
uniref:Uncharacterized protein n=1 Tax=Anguilla anguilla TaxID=7936 RepID=A0A0E9W8I2_ANGAN